MPPIADMRYRVQRKEITGKPATEGGLFHTVAYCLQPRGVDWCWWILCNYDADTPFKDVQRAQPAAQTSEASPQQSTPAAGDAQPATPPAAEVPKVTVAEAQKFVQTVSGDKAKLQSFCDLGKLQDQMEKAVEKNDTNALEALGKKADDLAQQIGPDYAKLMNGLDEIDPNSAEAKQFTGVFDPLVKQCT